MKRYVSKASGQEVAAMQWSQIHNGSIAQKLFGIPSQLRTFRGSGWSLFNLEGSEVIISATLRGGFLHGSLADTRHSLDSSDWIVVFHDGSWDWRSDIEFDRLFEPAPIQMRAGS